MEENLSPTKEKILQKLKGSLSGLIAGLFFSLSNSLVQKVLTQNKTNNLSQFEVIFITSVVQILLISILLAWKRKSPLASTRTEFALLMGLGLAKFCCIAFFMAALKLLPLGDATVILYTAPAWVFFFGLVFLKEKFSIFNLFFGILSFLGVVIIAAPDYFFPTTARRYSHIHSLVKANNTTSSNMDSVASGNYKGVLFALATAISLSINMVVIKKSTMFIDYYVTILYPHIYGVIVSPIIMVIMQKYFVLGQITLWSWLLLLATGLSNFLAMLLIAFALSLEDTSPIAFIRNSEVLFAFIFEITIAHKIPMMFSIVGVILILLTTSMIVLNRMFSIEKRIWRMLKLYCCNRKDEKPDKENYEMMK